MRLSLLALIAALTVPSPVQADATVVQPPYADPKVLFDFYFDDPIHINSALHWLRSLILPLGESPYDKTPEMMDIVVLIHGTEIVTVVKHNAAKYQEAVERMRYYADLGVKFRVCSRAAQDYGYNAADFQDFVELAPSAMAELVHWQQQGYAVISPTMMSKRYSIEEIR
jgi:intracellular sulfur oxidation DsrE/DsrF family protein